MDNNRKYITNLRLLGEKIRTSRIEKGLSQEKLAEKAGLHRNYISNLELAQKNPSYTTLIKIATSLGVSVSEIIPDERNRKSGN